MQKLSNKVAVITGGTTGIGLATAKLFDAEGASLVLTGRDPTAIESARRELPRADVLAADQGSLEDIDRLVAHVRARHDHVDVLFVNAGVAKFRPLEAVDEGFFDELVGINLKGAFFTVQRFAPLLRDGASVVLNTSVAGSKGTLHGTVYGLSKAGLRSLARTLSTELAPRHIRVNAISPGPIETPIFGKTGASADAIAAMKQRMTDAVPMKRLGAPDEVARAALFLASSDSSFVLGSELAVDGGLTQL